MYMYMHVILYTVHYCSIIILQLHVYIHVHHIIITELVQCNYDDIEHWPGN